MSQHFWGRLFARHKHRIILIICKTHSLQLLSPLTILVYIGKGTSCKAIQNLNMHFNKWSPNALTSKISICECLSISSHRLLPPCLSSNTKHYAYSNCVTIPNIIKLGTISQIRHLNHFEHIEQEPIVEASNKNGLKLVKYMISTSKWYDSMSYRIFNEFMRTLSLSLSNY